METPSINMNWYWGIWAIASFVAFIVPEVICLVKYPAGTLSQTLWRVENFLPGQNLWKWTAAHYLIGMTLTVMLVWLIGHLVFGMWR